MLTHADAAIGGNETVLTRLSPKARAANASINPTRPNAEKLRYLLQKPPGR